GGGSIASRRPWTSGSALPCVRLEVRAQRCAARSEVCFCGPSGAAAQFPSAHARPNPAGSTLRLAARALGPMAPNAVLPDSIGLLFLSALEGMDGTISGLQLFIDCIP